MFIAHLPAGFLCAKAVQRAGVKQRYLMAACLLGAIFPDFDLFYFYLFDKQSHHHHSYAIHFPIVWVGLCLFSSSLLYFTRLRTAGILATAFSANGLLHILLDGVVGDIQIFAPWSRQFYALAQVPALHHPWWLNFIFHWSFLIELFILSGAFLLLFLQKNKIK